MYSLILFWFSLLTPSVSYEKVEVLSLEQLQHKIIHQKNDTLYIVNFWATWCKPCVAELPYFEESAKKLSNQKAKVIFVSLNYARELNTVDKFVRQKNMVSTCYLLDAGTPNKWIDKIEPSWYGSIPATIMYKNGKKVFFREGEFGQAELDSIIKTKL